MANEDGFDTGSVGLSGHAQEGRIHEGESRIKTGFRLVFGDVAFTLTPVKALLLTVLLSSPCLAITKEVVRVFSPTSYHDTDSATEYGVKGDLVQAAVTDRPMVLSGAFPEDLAKAVFGPLQLHSNNKSYKVKEANLLVLCQLSFTAKRDDHDLEMIIDCSQLEIPEVVELTPRQVLSMTVEALRRTLRNYYEGDAHHSFHCHVTLAGLKKANGGLSDLETTFEVGNEQPGE